MRITLALLRRKHACTSQQDLFYQTFGNSMEVTLANLEKASNAGLHMTWAANQLVPKAVRDEFWRIQNLGEHANHTRWMRDNSGDSFARYVERSKKIVAYAAAAALLNSGVEVAV